MSALGSKADGARTATHSLVDQGPRFLRCPAPIISGCLERWKNAMTKILGRKRFAVLLTNFTDSANPTPFTLAQAEDAWDRIRKYWQYELLR